MFNLKLNKACQQYNTAPNGFFLIFVLFTLKNMEKKKKLF